MHIKYSKWPIYTGKFILYDHSLDKSNIADL